MKRFDLEAERRFSLKTLPRTFQAAPANLVEALFRLCTGRKDWATLFDHQRVLEVGAGECLFIPYILSVSRPQRYVATDLVPERMRWARRKIRNPVVEYQAANILALPFAAGQFDLALAFGLLHHIPDLTEALEEIARILRPGGKLIFRDPWAGNPAVRSKYKLFQGSPNEFPLFIRRLRRSLAAAGLKLLFLNRFWLRYPWLPPGPWSVNVGGLAIKEDNLPEGKPEARSPRARGENSILPGD